MKADVEAVRADVDADLSSDQTFVHTIKGTIGYSIDNVVKALLDAVRADVDADLSSDQNFVYTIKGKHWFFNN